MATKNMLILAVFALSFILITACGGGGQSGHTDEVDGDTTEATSQDGDKDSNESEVEVDGDMTEAADTVEADTVESGDTVENTEDNVPSWTDPVTGLRWALNDSTSALNHNLAIRYCQKLGNNRRLPTISELRSIVRGCDATSTGGACTIDDGCLTGRSCWNDSCFGCSLLDGPSDNQNYLPPELGKNKGAKTYWSSSPDPSWTGAYWLMHFHNAGVSNEQPDELFEVICVSGP